MPPVELPPASGDQPPDTDADSTELLPGAGDDGPEGETATIVLPLPPSRPRSRYLPAVLDALIPGLGHLVAGRRGRALLFAAPFLVITQVAEQAGNPALVTADVDQAHTPSQAGGNMEGKEVRFGIAASTLWAVATTAASNGSVNSMHDSYTPLGGLAQVTLMALGEVAFGGVGSGLYGLLMFAIVAVFIAGLMVGRTPEFLGKKIEAFEMKMASIAILVPVVAVLCGTAIACLTASTTGALANHGPHGFSEVLYAMTSQGNNNGSAFAGLTASGTLLATLGGVCMWIARYWIIIPTLAIAGAIAAKQRIPTSPGTLPTDGPLFVVLLAGVVLLVGALSFLPALALGPIVEHLSL